MKTNLRGARMGAFFAISCLLVAGAFVSAPSVGAQSLTESQTRAISTNLGIFGGNTWDIAVDGTHVYAIADGVPNGFFYSSNAAVTWSRPVGTNDFGSGQSVEVDRSTHAVYVALGGTLYKSTDYGATLISLNTPAGFALLAAQGKIVSAANDTAYFSADDGTTFTSVVIASGKTISDLAASATAGTFYATTYDDGVGVLYRSTDSGATWSVVSVNDGSAVTTFTNVDTNPSDANDLAVGTNDGLWLSTDAGASWAKLGVSPARSCGPSATWTSTRLYACSGYTLDDGTTWTDLDVHTNVMRGPGKSIVFDATDESVMYGDCMSGVCKSTNGGLVWQNSLDGITGVNVLAISQTADKKTVWISSSNGLGKTSNFTDASPTWSWPILPCDEIVRCDSSGIGEAVWVKPDNSSIVLAGSYGGYIYRSTDAGTTWTAQIPSVIDQARFKTGSTNNLRPKFFLGDAVGTNTVYLALYDPIGDLGAVLKSVDSGTTWTDLAIADDAPATILAVTKSGVIYAGTGYDDSVTKGLYKYAAGSWSKLSGIDTRLNIQGLLVDPEAESTIYASATADLAPIQADGFYKSTDAGLNWTKVVPSGYHGFGAITVQRSTVPNSLYMSAIDDNAHGVLLKSSDAGTTWGALYTGLKSESFTAVLFDGLVAGNKHGVFNIKSRASFTTGLSASTITKTVGARGVVISARLRDATTRKLLGKKTVNLYVKKNGRWVKKASGKTNTKGLIRFRVRMNKSTQYMLKWTPGRNDRAEYFKSTSNIQRVTVK